jgi:uncharacterized coiled-coil protein SlyX
MQNQINLLKEQADAAEGAEQEALNQRIETLETQHANAKAALDDLKDAEVAQWQAYQEPVRTAMNELSSSMNNVR